MVARQLLTPVDIEELRMRMYDYKGAYPWKRGDAVTWKYGFAVCESSGQVTTNRMTAYVPPRTGRAAAFTLPS
ncbi:hypothetical protein KC326_g87 [Hortaea werneckii]|nr:hypothetical protein KC326_g87 [Hortaea werneckii]